MTTAEQKAAEANGTEVLKEVRSDNLSDGPSEEIPQYEKRNRKAECIYISIAVVLGAALIGVLVYFSVTNAFDSDDPVAAENRGAASTDLYTTTDLPSTTDTGFNSGANGMTRDTNQGGGGGTINRSGSKGNGVFIGGGENTESGPTARGLPRARVAPPPADTNNSSSTTTTTTTTTTVAPADIPSGRLLPPPSTTPVPTTTEEESQTTTQAPPSVPLLRSVKRERPTPTTTSPSTATPESAQTGTGETGEENNNDGGIE